MAILLLIVVALLLPLTLLYLTLSVNDFEKSTKALAVVIQKRYHLEPPKKAGSPAASMQSIVKPGKA